MRFTKQQYSGRETRIKRTSSISKGKKRSLTILMGSFQSTGPGAKIILEMEKRVGSFILTNNVPTAVGLHLV